jgi:hypothetical protein
MHAYRFLALYWNNARCPFPLQDAKIDWLARVIAETQELAGPLEVKPGKIVAGLEPEFTNRWLVAMAKCARGDFKPAPAPAPAPAIAAPPKKKESSPSAAPPLKPTPQQQQLHEEPPPRAAPPPQTHEEDNMEQSASAAAPPARAARLERPVTARRPPPAPRAGTSGADRPPPPPPAAAVVIIGDGAFFLFCTTLHLHQCLQATSPTTPVMTALRHRSTCTARARFMEGWEIRAPWLLIF